MRLLVTVNAAMAALVLAFLALDYRRELADGLVQKQVALEEEAKTLLPAVLRLRRDGSKAVQEYLDAVCGRMRDAQSPGHHIAVRLDEAVVQATAHRRSSADLFRAMEEASRSPGRRAQFRDRDLVVGSAQAAGVATFVSEELGVLRHAVLGRILWPLAGVLALGAVAAGLVSTVLLRVVDKPLRRLVATVDHIAAGNLSARARACNSVELTSLSESINAMAASLEDADRHRRREMARARQIQEHLLPKEIEIPGLRLAALYRPARGVAGDYYDALSLPDGSWLLCIADVSGHGVPAALSAAMLKAFLLHAAEHHVAPDQILAFVSRRFAAASPPGLFASMLLVRWAPGADALSYAGAGHEPAWLLSDEGEPRPLKATGLFLGIEGEATWGTRTLPVRPGDRLLLVTDGAAENVQRAAGTLRAGPPEGPAGAVPRPAAGGTARRRRLRSGGPPGGAATDRRHDRGGDRVRRPRIGVRVSPCLFSRSSSSPNCDSQWGRPAMTAGSVTSRIDSPRPSPRWSVSRPETGSWTGPRSCHRFRPSPPAGRSSLPGGRHSEGPGS